MINNFVEIVPKKLYRGSAPTPHDVLTLKKKYHIKKIVSLDEESSNKINRSCKMLGINHVSLPIHIENVRVDLIKLFKHDLKKLLLDGCPTFLHCYAGKDRTGLVSALFECKYLNKDPEEAIKEAKKLGFGIGLDPKITNLFEKLIRSCKSENKPKETKHYDIVSNEREYISDNRDSFLDEAHQGSFAPYLDHTKQYPMDALYNYVYDQSPTRENYSRDFMPGQEQDVVPIVGLYNNDAGVKGFGPAENMGGFIYD